MFEVQDTVPLVMLPVREEPDLFSGRITVVTVMDCTWDSTGLPVLLNMEMCHRNCATSQQEIPPKLWWDWLPGKGKGAVP